jgi:hypothetical protein
MPTFTNQCWFANTAATSVVMQGSWPWPYYSAAVISSSSIWTTALNTISAVTFADGNWRIDGLPNRVNIVSAKTRRRMRREQERFEAEMGRARAERRATEEAAVARARALLFSALTRDQQRSLEERQFFEMNVNGKTYRIHQGTHGNVRLVQGGEETRLFCAQPPNVPVEDAMLAQKLMLETDEQAFLRVANERILTARAA